MPLTKFSDFGAIGTPARGFMWKVSMTPPVGNGAMLTYRARRVSIPKREFAPIIDPFMALEITDTGAPTYEHDCTIMFTENNNGDISGLIEAWLNLSYDPVNGTAQPKANRVTNVDLFLYASSGDKVLRHYQLVGAQPRNNTSGTDLAYEDKGAKVEFPVTFLFDYYVALAA